MLSWRNSCSKYAVIVIIVLFLSCIFGTIVFSQEIMMYGFEDNNQGWEVPFWSCEKNEYKTGEVNISKEVSRQGKSSLEMIVDFPGNRWSAGIVEVEGNFDLSESKYIIFDIYIPETAPKCLETKIILALEGYHWLEMNKTFNLEPGKWKRVKASLKKNCKWWTNCGQIKLTQSLKREIYKIGIRIESNNIRYAGPVFIDNITLSI